MSIARRHVYTAVPQQMLNRDKIDSGSHETSREHMPQIVKSQMGYLRQPHRLHESDFGITETFSCLPRARKDKFALSLLPRIGQ